MNFPATIRAKDEADIFMLISQWHVIYTQSQQNVCRYHWKAHGANLSFAQSMRYAKTRNVMWISQIGKSRKNFSLPKISQFNRISRCQHRSNINQNINCFISLLYACRLDKSAKDICSPITDLSRLTCSYKGLGSGSFHRQIITGSDCRGNERVISKLACLRESICYFLFWAIIQISDTF